MNAYIFHMFHTAFWQTYMLGEFKEEIKEKQKLYRRNKRKTKIM